MIPTRLVFIPVSADLPAAVLIVGADGAVAAQPALTLDNATDLTPMRTLAIAPGADVLVRQLVLPVGAAAQVRAAALWILRADLAAPADRLSVALGPAGKEGDPRVVAVVGAALVQAWSDYLASLGVRPEAIVPDNLILPPPHEAETLYRRDLGADVVLRGTDLAVTTQADLADIMVHGRTVDAVDDVRWARALAAMALAPPLDLRARSKGLASADRTGGGPVALAAAAHDRRRPAGHGPGRCGAGSDHDDDRDVGARSGRGGGRRRAGAEPGRGRAAAGGWSGLGRSIRGG